MNTYQILAIVGISLIAIMIVWIVSGIIWIQYKKGAFFCFLPHNHTALVEVEGKPLHWLMHKADRKATEGTIVKMESEGFITADKKAEILGSIVTRSGILVSLFNLHLTSLNPFARIRPIEVVKTGLKELFEEGSPLSSHMKDVSRVNSNFLRLSWPRTNYIPEIELIDQVKTNLIVTATKVRVWDLHKIYYEFSGKVSEMVDGAIASAFIQHLGNKTLDEFQKENLTAWTGPGSLHAELQGKGIEAVGAWLEGPLAVSDWELGKEQQRIKDANLARAAAEAEKEVVITVAKGIAESTQIKARADAEAIRLKGFAEAEILEKSGKAFARVNKKLVEAFNDSSSDAAKVAAAKELSKPGSNIKVIGGNSIVNLD